MRNYTKLCLLALMVISLSACNCKKGMKDLTLKSNTEEFMIYMEDSNTNIMEQTSMIINSQEDLESFFKVFNATKTPKITIPKVDFNSQSVLVVATGEKPSGGYSVMKPTLEPGKINSYFFKIKSPGPKDLVTMSLTTPGMIVIANQPAKEVEVNLLDE